MTSPERPNEIESADYSWLDKIAEEQEQTGWPALVRAALDIEEQLIALGEEDWLKRQ